jgi:hypothetical protein
LEYTNCLTDAPNNGQFADMSSDLITSHFKTSDNGSSSLDPSKARWQRRKINITYDSVTAEFDQCSVTFNIPENVAPPVLMFYKLENFYQNHRRYVTSFSSQQLSGTALSGGDVNSSNCAHLNTDVNGSGKPIYPCGLIANSLFNDTYGSPVLLNVQNSANSSATYQMQNNTNIAWSSEADLYGKTEYNYSQIVPPPNWAKRYPNGYTATLGPPDLKTWQHFHNWMRTAATPDFTKLYQRNDVDTMKSGTYQLDIQDNFNVTAFNGRKYIVISTLSALGGRNPYIGIIFLATGGFCLIMTVVFSVGHLLRPRKMGDHTYLSWNNVPAGAASGTATGVDVGRGSARQR